MTESPPESQHLESQKTFYDAIMAEEPEEESMKVKNRDWSLSKRFATAVV